MATNKTVLSVALSGRVTASVADPYAGHGPLENRDGRRTIRTGKATVKGYFENNSWYLKVSSTAFFHRWKTHVTAVF